MPEGRGEHGVDRPRRRGLRLSKPFSTPSTPTMSGICGRTRHDRRSLRVPGPEGFRADGALRG